MVIRKRNSASTKGFQNKKKGKESRGWFLTALLSISSALGGALLENSTKIVQDKLKPVMTDAACHVQEAFKHNTAPHRFTVVVLKFTDDENSRVSKAISTEMAEKYSVNVIESCLEIAMLPSGDRANNVSNAQNKVSAIITKYDADMVIFGTVSGTESKIIVTNSIFLKYLFNDQYGFAEDFDSLKSAEYVQSYDFLKKLIQYSADSARSSRCVDAIYTVCNVGNKTESKERLINLVNRLRPIQSYYIDSRVLKELGKIAQYNFSEIGALISAVSVNLLVFHGVQKIESDGKTEDVLDIADSSLFLTDVNQDGIGQIALNEMHTVSAMIGRGVIATMRARSCKSDTEAKKAISWLGSALQKLGPPDQLWADKPLIIMSLLRLGQAQLLAYALSIDDLAASNVQLDFDETMKWLTKLIPENLDHIFTTTFLGDEYEQFREDLKKKITDEYLVLRAANLQQTKGEIVKLFKPSIQMSKC